MASLSLAPFFLELPEKLSCMATLLIALFFFEWRAQMLMLHLLLSQHFHAFFLHCIRHKQELIEHILGQYFQQRNWFFYFDNILLKVFILHLFGIKYLVFINVFCPYLQYFLFENLPYILSDLFWSFLPVKLFN